MKKLLHIPLLLVQLFATASVLEVGPGKQFNTIKSAIHSAVNGDLIMINKARYVEGEIIIKKTLTLRGIGFPTIDGNHNSQVFLIEADGVVLEGLDVRNAGYSSAYDWAAIKVVDSRNVTIRYNRLLNNSSAIYLQNTAYSEISNNSISGNDVDEFNSGNAIHCWKSHNLRILNNSLTKHRDGLYFEFVTSSLIQNNSSFNNLRYGIHFMFSNDDTYIRNTFRANGSGVAVMFSKNVVMRYNKFVENRGSAAYGMMLKEIGGGTVEHNQFSGNTVGIYMEGTSRMTVSNNTFKSNGWAMRVQASCIDNTITLNNYFGNTFDVGTNGSMQQNNFHRNYWDKYEGYDLNKDGKGDIQYQPVSLYSMIVEKMPSASLMLRSFIVTIMDRAERLIPSITPVDLNDAEPLMKPVVL